jgi:hypothetical protein
MAGRLLTQRARVNKHSDHASFLFKFVPPFRVMTREVEALTQTLTLFTGPVEAPKAVIDAATFAKVGLFRAFSRMDKLSQLKCCNFASAANY